MSGSWGRGRDEDGDGDRNGDEASTGDWTIGVEDFDVFVEEDVDGDGDQAGDGV